MLVLTREKNEQIRIGDDVVITVVEIRTWGGTTRVRLGIEAPREVPVHRGEVWDKIAQQNAMQQAGGSFVPVFDCTDESAGEPGGQRKAAEGDDSEEG